MHILFEATRDFGKMCLISYNISLMLFVMYFLPFVISCKPSLALTRVSTSNYNHLKSWIMVLLDNSFMTPTVYYPLEHLMLDTVEEVAQNIFLFFRHTTWAFLLCVMWRAARGYHSPRISTCVQILWALYKAVLILCFGYMIEYIEWGYSIYGY